MRKMLIVVLGAGLLVPMAAQAPQPPARYPELPSETPARLARSTDGFDHARRDVMIPMRDGVRLHTVVLVPTGARHAPILLTRTPYDATALTSHAPSAHLGPVLQGYDNAVDVIVDGGYIRVVQDIRGKYKSEGDFVINRPIRGSQNPTPVDEATDTFDSIDWNGAFRQQNMSYIYEQEGTRANDADAKWVTSHFDDFDMFMQATSAGELGRRRGLDQMGFWQKITEHAAYDAFWRDQAVDRVLAAQSLTVPTSSCTASGIRRTSTGTSPCTRRSSPRTQPTTKCSS